jgi:hypothetical protein
MILNLISKFSALPCSPKTGDFIAVPVSSTRADFLVKGERGEPIFLLKDQSPKRYIVGRVLRNIRIDFHITCIVKTEESIVGGQYAIISCASESPELFEIFIRCVGAAISNLPVMSSTSELETVVHELLEIFRTLAEPSGKEIGGLWGELWVILHSGDIVHALELWHSDKNERFDFSSNSDCIEVKTTTKAFRIHEFSLEQLSAPLGGNGSVISVLLQKASGGKGVIDLVAEIELAIVGAHRLQCKLWSVVLGALGCDFSDKVDIRYDMSYTQRNLLVFNMDDIPSVGTVLDSRVSAVHFVSDLSNVRSSLEGQPRDCLERLFSV